MPKTCDPAPRRLLRRSLFALWALSYVPIVVAVRSRLPAAPFRRSLLGAAAFWVSAVAGFWLLGRQRNRTLLVWRVVFALLAMFLVPLLLTIAVGVADQGWPSGRFNRPIAHVLTLVLGVSIPAFLLGLLALLRMYRVAAVLALLTGLDLLALAIPLLRATSPIKIFPIHLDRLLDVVAFFAKLVSYLAIPIGVAFVAGGIMMFRAAQAARTR